MGAGDIRARAAEAEAAREQAAVLLKGKEVEVAVLTKELEATAASLHEANARAVSEGRGRIFPGGVSLWFRSARHAC